MSARTEFYWSRRKVGWLGALTAFICAFGVLLIAFGDEGAQILGYAWIAAFVALFVSLVHRSRSLLPVITVDERGLFDRRGFKAPVPWSDIGAVEPLVVEGMSLVGIALTDEALGAARPLLRSMKWPNRLFGMPAFSISMHPLDGSAEDLIAAIARHRVQDAALNRRQ